MSFRLPALNARDSVDASHLMAFAASSMLGCLTPSTMTGLHALSYGLRRAAPPSSAYLIDSPQHSAFPLDSA